MSATDFALDVDVHTCDLAYRASRAHETSGQESRLGSPPASIGQGQWGF